jgi:hypothetical protein
MLQERWADKFALDIRRVPVLVVYTAIAASCNRVLAETSCVLWPIQGLTTNAAQQLLVWQR